MEILVEGLFILGRYGSEPQDGVILFVGLIVRD